MTTITDLVKGQADWQKTINDNFDNIITDTGWISTGVTQVNGASPACKYRVIKLHDATLTAINMYYKTNVDYAVGSNIVVINWPTSIFPDGFPSLNSNAGEIACPVVTAGGKAIRFILTESGLSVSVNADLFKTGDSASLSVIIPNAN